MAQFGNGDIIPSWSAIRKAKTQKFYGHLVNCLDDVILLMNENKNDMNTWVVRPKYSGSWIHNLYLT